MSLYASVCSYHSVWNMFMNNTGAVSVSGPQQSWHSFQTSPSQSSLLNKCIILAGSRGRKTSDQHLSPCVAGRAVLSINRSLAGTGVVTQRYLKLTTANSLHSFIFPTIQLKWQMRVQKYWTLLYRRPRNTFMFENTKKEGATQWIRRTGEQQNEVKRPTN